LLDTFFEGNVENAVATLIDDKSRQLSREELDRIGKLIEEARKRQ
jgi:hypothetical protein